MNKKIIAALSLVMLFSAFSCRGNKNPSSEPTSNPPISEVTTSQDSTKEESTPSEEPSQEVSTSDSPTTSLTPTTSEESTSSETPSVSETPSTSETPATSETPVTSETTSNNPSSNDPSSEDTTTSENTSNNQTSSTPVVNLDPITFGSVAKDIEYSVDKIKLPSWVDSVEMVKGFGTGNEEVKLGSSKAIGSLVFTLNEAMDIEKIIIDASRYSDKTTELKVTLSDGQTKTLGVTGTNQELVFEFEANNVTTIKVETTNNGKRAQLTSISVYGEGSNGGQGGDSSETPSTSETPATSETPVTSETTSNNPSSNDPSSEDTTTSENTSNNQTSSTPVVNLDPITFDCYASTSDLPVSVANLPSWVSSVEFTKILGQDDTTIKLGSSKVAGKLVFTLTESIDIERIVINGNKYTDSENKLTVTLSDGKTQTLTFDSTGKLVFEFDANNSTTITIEANKRAYITSIEVYAEDGNSGQGGSVVQPTQELLTYSSTKTPTSGNTVSQKQTYSGYYKPVVNDELNIDNYTYYYGTDNLPSTGKSKILVVPVDFTDYRAASKLGGEEESQTNIYNTFFGESEETGWESVRTYYEKSSYGSLLLEGVVTPWYHSSFSTTSLSNQYANAAIEDSNVTDPTWTLLDEVTSWAKNTLKIDLSEYDLDNDGFIDGIWMIYSCPEEYNDSEAFWAFTYWNFNNWELSYENPNNLYPFNYGWASYNFMFEGGYGLPDAHTYIHETGHMLGLDDYYAYPDDEGNPANEGVCGGVDMMDNNIGDHGAYSKYLLNWTSPYVIDGTQNSVTINLKPFESSGEFILLGNGFNDSAFDEYITIEYYTPTGLNEKDKNGYADGLNTYTQAGIKINHIDSRIVQDFYNNYDEIDHSLYINSFDDEYGYYSICASNTPSSSYDLDGYNFNSFRLNHLIEANKNYTFNTSNYMDNYGSNDVLFHTGDTFSLSTYSKFFANGAKLNNDKTLSYTVTIGSVNQDGSITITITK